MLKEKGFSLIELLVVVAIIGILAAIAIPQYSEYRSKAYDQMALSDLKALINSLESYYADNNTYVSCNANSGCALALPGFKGTEGTRVDVGITVTDHFEAYSCHPSGTKRYAFVTSDPWGNGTWAGQPIVISKIMEFKRDILTDGWDECLPT